MQGAHCTGPPVGPVLLDQQFLQQRASLHVFSYGLGCMFLCASTGKPSHTFNPCHLRELAVQLAEQFRAFGAGMSLRVSFTTSNGCLGGEVG